MGIHKKLYLSLPLYIFSAVAPFIMRYNSPKNLALVSFVAGVVYLIYLYGVIVISGGRFDFNEALTMYSMSVYIIASFLSLLFVRDFKNIGQYIYLLIFIGAWSTDIFAYFTGRFLGKHKLAKDISPKKTVEGSIGGIVFCAISYAVFGFIMDKYFEADSNILLLVISGVVISVISQVGDLIMSAIKRRYNIKDYGKIFPGHGGVLDRFDSILSVSLGFAALCVVVELIGINII